MNGDRPNWGWGEKEPVAMFTEAEIRSACKDFGLQDGDADTVIEQLNENRQNKRAAGRDPGDGGLSEDHAES
ncbi:hypothetical protein C0J29_08585 [Mycobacterium paragordonae]|nr:MULTISPECIES: hypothetical protein [Mycobacterium]AYE94828.1 hypothetical protein C0J29_08585 [Mycobacterium paragordonae]OBJ78910.1 hypothetical protein A9W97_02795 [Mycobacterium gordonae]PJE20351.1 MAG: hypothetical protein CK431_27520 [Mycobacterium sp.]